MSAHRSAVPGRPRVAGWLITVTATAVAIATVAFVLAV